MGVCEVGSADVEWPAATNSDPLNAKPTRQEIDVPQPSMNARQEPNQ
jgi:hypothetical protein